ncbi:tRNA (N6-isopentenyl adenosine(37)-C2)-methylthiotransferase MiaB [Peptoniphilus stercorisuis]|uniref:tRNA-2-methylthio-N(6)-dimethylallyladenosine synthase n=1 Tax=Peptoniphilus stercorisuis TaxID=1436965 RepID=A0ABS4KCM5_9FIRM|nr:tRNA (N6-isopentenyl adenosine(37)-C2)-methylthiotransferase MiaB [Peptoniphilus stercorisuis]MBP2025528.1 tRNA-2-methylthio-N6-dimethylallyladenosine synthase [Peptoniphilus stercorisuis]
MENLNLINDYNENIEEYIRKLRNNYTNNKVAKIVTHGCQMNEHDSEKIRWLLEKMGYIFSENEEECDLVILNTCSIRHSAEDKVYGQIGRLKHLKQTKPSIKVAVCGCMMQRDESREYVLEKFENVNIIFGTNNIYKFPELLYKNYCGKKLSMDIEENFKNIDDKLGANRLYSYKSYVNIMYGCDNFCTYCIVPYTRGREVSRDPYEIIEEVKDLVKNGTKEITLLGQNVNSYGKSLNSDMTFTKLLYKINDIEGLERIRFMTSHPKDISDELIYAFKDLDKLCNFLHLPVQAGSTKVLKEMNRRYTKEEYLEKIEKIKKINPDIALCTDIMVGFPGETEEDFNETLDLVQRVEYDTSFTFIYSLREGTKAAKSSEQVPENIKHERFERLLDVLYPIQLEKNKAFINKIVKVLVEDLSTSKKGNVIGRTSEFKLVSFPGDESLIGKTIDVKIVDANTFALVGEQID